jgi:hypothetical protein
MREEGRGDEREGESRREEGMTGEQMNAYRILVGKVE